MAPVAGLTLLFAFPMLAVLPAPGGEAPPPLMEVFFPPSGAEFVGKALLLVGVRHGLKPVKVSATAGGGPEMDLKNLGGGKYAGIVTLPPSLSSCSLRVVARGEGGKVLALVNLKIRRVDRPCNSRLVRNLPLPDGKVYSRAWQSEHFWTLSLAPPPEGSKLKATIFAPKPRRKCSVVVADPESGNFKVLWRKRMEGVEKVALPLPRFGGRRCKIFFVGRGIVVASVKLSSPKGERELVSPLIAWAEVSPGERGCIVKVYAQATSKPSGILRIGERVKELNLRPAGKGLFVAEEVVEAGNGQPFLFSLSLNGERVSGWIKLSRKG